MKNGSRKYTMEEKIRSKDKQKQEYLQSTVLRQKMHERKEQDILTLTKKTEEN